MKITGRVIIVLTLRMTAPPKKKKPERKLKQREIRGGTETMQTTELL